MAAFFHSIHIDIFVDFLCCKVDKDQDDMYFHRCDFGKEVALHISNYKTSICLCIADVLDPFFHNDSMSELVLDMVDKDLFINERKKLIL